MSSRIPLVPAVIPASASQVRETCQQFTFSHEYHLDIVDGSFVPAISWPFAPKGDPQEVKKYTDCYTLEVDLMVADPVSAATSWEAAGADMLVFHVETISPEELSTFAKRSKVSIGISLHGDTPLESLASYMAETDYVQLMGIRTIGAQGLPFHEHVLDSIVALRAMYPNLTISIDGSMNAVTIPRVIAAGANRIIVGSAITLAASPQEAYSTLRTLIN